jgi:hypothetical protein
VQPVRKRKVGDKRFGYAVRNHVRSLIEEDQIMVLDDPWRLVGGPDPDLTEKGQARSMTDEVALYVYRMPPEGRELAVAQREDPDPMCADHAMNALEYLASAAWASDFTPLPEDPGVPEFTYGALLGHDEVYAEPGATVLDSTFDDYTPALQGRRPR